MTRILYDSKSAAEALSMSEDKLAQLRRAGLIDAKWAGKAWHFLHSDLVAYAEGLKDSAEAS